MLAQDAVQTEATSQYIQTENKIYVQTRTTVRATNSLSHYTKRYVSISFGLYQYQPQLLPDYTPR